MEIQQLRHLLAAADSPNYVQAAKKCFTSRQNIAHSIKALEEELGVLLFARDGNRMGLTLEGSQVVFAATEIITRVDHLRTMFSDRKSFDITLSLAVSTNLFAGMPTGVDDFLLEKAESLRFLELDCEECYRLVCSGETDAAVVMCMERKFPECDVVEVGRSCSYIITNESSKLAKKESILVSDLIDQKLLLMSGLAFQYAPLLVQLSALGFSKTDVSILPSTSSMLHVVRTRQEGSVGIVSEKFAAVPPRGTVSVPVGDSKLDWHFYILYKASEANFGSVMRFVRGIKNAFQKKEVAGGGGFLFRKTFRQYVFSYGRLDYMLQAA